VDVLGDHGRSTKDLWDKIQVTAIAVSAAALPLVIAVFGNSYNASIKEKEIRLKTVEIAINVLSQDPKVNTSIPQLREWAITVVDNYSGVPLTALAREELLKNPLPSKEVARVVDLLSSSFEGQGGGFFIESSVEDYKFFQGNTDLTAAAKRARADSPIIGKESVETFSVVVDGKQFEISVPIKAGQLTKLVIEKSKVYVEGPLAPSILIKK
jgi:hypothetical protein